MAVSPAFTFDYEARVRPDERGGFEGAAHSLQERDGALPGLAGPAPLVRIAGDIVHIESQALQSSTGRLLEAFSVLIPPLSNKLVDRRLKRASVRRIELAVPGLGDVIRADHVLRAVLKLDDGGVPEHPLLATVSVRSGDGVSRQWDEVPVALVPL